MVVAVKIDDIVLDTPLTLRPQDTINTALDLTHRRCHRASWTR